MWLVIENTPGHMPDSEPADFRTKRQAMAYAASLANELREQGYQVTGSHGNYTAEHPDRIHDLGRVIETDRHWE